MSAFIGCQAPGCKSDAHYKCSCLFYFCDHHINLHKKENYTVHKAKKILMNLNTREIFNLSQMNMQEFFSFHIEREKNRKERSLKDLYRQIEQIQKESMARIEKLLEIKIKCTDLIREILDRKALPLFSRIELALELGKLKKNSGLSTNNVRTLIFEQFSMPNQELPENINISRILRSKTSTKNSLKRGDKREKILKSRNENPFKTDRSVKSAPRIQLTLEDSSNSVNEIQTSPCKKYIASGNADGSVKIWKSNTGELQCILKEHTGSVKTVNFLPSSNLIVSGSEDNTAKIWDLNTLQCLLTYKRHSNWVYSTCFSPDSKLVASGSGDKTVQIWRVNDASKVSALKGHTAGVTKVSFTSNPDKIVSSGSDKKIIIWQVSSKTILKTLAGHSGAVVTFSLSGRFLASGGSDQDIFLWNLDTGKFVRALNGHSNIIKSIDFSECGKFIVSASTDNSIKIWNHNELVKDFPNIAHYAQFLGNKVVSSGIDQDICVWRI